MDGNSASTGVGSGVGRPRFAGGCCGMNAGLCGSSGDKSIALPRGAGEKEGIEGVITSSKACVSLFAVHIICFPFVPLRPDPWDVG